MTEYRVTTNGFTFRIEYLRLESWFRKAKWVKYHTGSETCPNGLFYCEEQAQHQIDKLLLTEEREIQREIDRQKAYLHREEERISRANQANTWKPTAKE